MRFRVLMLCGMALFQPYAHAETGAWEVTDSTGRHWFTDIPQKVATTDWTIAENLLALGVTPIGLTEVDAYRALANPALPTNTVDIGLRVEPNLARIKSLAPDIILTGTGQKHLMRPLSRLGRLLHYRQFSDRYRTNGTKADIRYLQLAALFKKTAQAEAQLEKRNTRIKDLAKRLNQFSQPVSLVQLTHTGEIRAYGHNSLPGHALILLGLTNGLEVPASNWGEAKLSLSDLNGAKRGPILFFGKADEIKTLKQSSDWQTLANWVHNCLIALPPLWPYGSALSFAEHAERITAAVQTHSCPPHSASGA